MLILVLDEMQNLGFPKWDHEITFLIFDRILDFGWGHITGERECFFNKHVHHQYQFLKEKEINILD